MSNQNLWYPQQPPNFIHTGIDTSKKHLLSTTDVHLFRVPSIGAPHKRKFFLLDDNKQILQWISPKKNLLRSRINLKDIREIHIGIFYSKRMKALAKSKKYRDQEYISMSIVYGQNQILDLIAPDQDVFKFWLTGLQFHINECYFSSDSLVSARLQYYKNIWAEVDQDMDHHLNFNEIKVMVNKMNIDLKDEYLKKLCQDFDTNGSNNLDFDEFVKMMDKLHERKELEVFFNKYKGQDGYIHAQQFFEFFKEEQGEIVPYEDCDQIIRKVIREDQLNKNGPSVTNGGITIGRGMDLIDFTRYVYSKEFNSFYNPKLTQIYQDMNLPLTQYFCNSTHNTYLTGHQLKGDSSIEMYKESLLNGCRCVEIDCWDGPGNEPKVTHGFTMTSSITFKSVIEAIAESAFTYSQYPVIISLEMHCSPKQQQVIAKYMIDILGDENIYRLPQGLNLITELHEIPQFESPESLRNKFVIKSKTKRIKPQFKESLSLQAMQKHTIKRFQTKMAQEMEDADGQTNESRSGQMKLTPNKSGYHKLILKNRQLDTNRQQWEMPKEKYTDDGILILDGEEYDQEQDDILNKIDDDATLNDKEKEALKKSQLAMMDPQEVSNTLGSLTSLIGSHFNKDDISFPWEIKSLDENKIVKFVKAFDRKYWISHHLMNFTRVYPKGTRFDSSNYSPIFGWSTGAQIVAINYQTKDEPNLLNQCFFEQNGGRQSGYILKSPFLRGLVEQDTLKTKIIKIWLLSGSQIPKKSKDSDIVDPFVTIDIITTSDSERVQNQAPFKSKAIDNNGFNPVWDMKCNFQFIKDEINMLVVKVWDQDSNGQTLLCWNALNIQTINKGLRVIEMKDTKLKPSGCKLLCYFSFHELGEKL